MPSTLAALSCRVPSAAGGWGGGRRLCSPHFAGWQTEAQGVAGYWRGAGGGSPDGGASPPSPRRHPSSAQQMALAPGGPWGGGSRRERGSPPPVPPSLAPSPPRALGFIEVLKCLECHPAPVSRTAVCLLGRPESQASCCACVLQVLNTRPTALRHCRAQWPSCPGCPCRGPLGRLCT